MTPRSRRLKYVFFFSALSPPQENYMPAQLLTKLLLTAMQEFPQESMASMAYARFFFPRSFFGSKTMVVGGLQSLQTLEKATLWLNDKLKTLNGLCQQGTYMKSPQFQGLLFAKFSSTCERDTAVAMLGSAGLREGGTRVWATQDLPLLTRARKMFLIGLKWQLTQWGEA